ncbi:MAG: prolipoprotein diacylglyceryl transferase [Lactobacillales bacterium]|jgi:phosphatidylglycerol:prolipoprotein diacylglycerol transferase|nr:prolipoprotein diacylglyceryl transferase [Lactobacillales bacterium]
MILFGFIHVYAICILLGIITGVASAMILAPKYDISRDALTDLILIFIPAGIVGARIYYVIFNLDYYLNNPSEIIMINNGGLAFYGGLIGVVAVLVIYTRIKKLSIINFLDIFAPMCLFGQAIGRWGNFFNQEAHGGEVTRKYLEGWRIIPKFVIDGMNIDGTYYLPTFYFESLACLIGAIIIFILLYKKITKPLDGAAFYLVWYGIFRTVIESQRSDSLYLGPIKVSMLLSALLVLAGLIIFIVRRKKK